MGVFLSVIIDVFIDCEGDGGIRYGFAEEPGYALLVGWSDGEVVAMKEMEKGYHLENAVIIIGEGFVLRVSQYGGK